MIKKITLINPSIAPEEMYGKLAGAGSTEPNLGLCSLAAYLRAQGYELSIIDAQVQELTTLAVINALEFQAPDLIGITSVTLGIDNAGKLADQIKQRFPAVPLIIGGVHVTAVPEETLTTYSAFDVGIIGEGELTCTELVSALSQGLPLNLVPGIIYRDKKGFVKTEPRPFIKNLDDLPIPAWDLLPELTKYYHTPATACNNSPSCSLVTTRGCGSKCTFCFQGAMGRICRGHSAERIIELILHLYNTYGIRDIRILDDIFVANRARLIKVCELLISLKLDLSWSCYARVDTINEDVLRLMKKAGCWQISYGIESGCQEILDLVKKNVTLAQIRNALALTKKVGIRSLGYFMVGFPTETKATIDRTIRFACSLELNDFKMNFLTPFPGTELHSVAEQYGSFNKAWNKMNMYVEPAFIPHDLTREELIAAKKRAFFRFYVRPKVVLSYLFGIRNLAHIKKLAIGTFSLLKYWILPEKIK
ncbi:MAG: hypothetical protein DKM50_11540 [Candidatus Margulisiibacteriota bacterium]|nr:MAG: hypothetical protein A2X43_02395 [Candidatus Margulisbacteria bacterium GWD2_39_127]PZM78407.1 MAG: hypothetical protein DKM50_11540 [Candidatus Margulisiibacteriota bacterium]HAR62378.1 hypothetical protein [Candidatus Margulisiibacteriota bacterium]HCY36558.1 hypothetical protein [Candidatus Margulisiibacteriota bacterium]